MSCMVYGGVSFQGIIHCSRWNWSMQTIYTICVLIMTEYVWKAFYWNSFCSLFQMSIFLFENYVIPGLQFITYWIFSELMHLMWHYLVLKWVCKNTCTGLTHMNNSWRQTNANDAAISTLTLSWITQFIHYFLWTQCVGQIQLVNHTHSYITHVHIAFQLVYWSVYLLVCRTNKWWLSPWEFLCLALDEASCVMFIWCSVGVTFVLDQ